MGPSVNPRGERTLSVALILKAKGAHVETTRPDATLYTVVWSLKVKGIGEAATIGSTPAIANAVMDALAPLGVTHVDLPLTARKVWAAIRAATKP